MKNKMKTYGITCETRSRERLSRPSAPSAPQSCGRIVKLLGLTGFTGDTVYLGWLEIIK